MKIGRLASVVVLNLLNNLLRTWHLLAVLERNFNSIWRSIRLFTFGERNMDDEGHVNERDNNNDDQPPPLPEELQIPEELMMAYDGLWLRDFDDDVELVSDPDDVDEDEDDDITTDDEAGISMSEDDEDDEVDEDDVDFEENSDFEMLWHLRTPSPVPSMYAFRALRLMKCHFKEGDTYNVFPVARSGHRITACDSNLYSLGGYHPHSPQMPADNGVGTLFQELWRFNFATRQWALVLNASNASNMPNELASNALVIHNNVLISYGGTGIPFGESCSNDCYIYMLADKSNVVRLETGGDMPLPQYGPGIVIHEHYLYTIGGTTGFDYSCDVYRLNLRTKEWECMYICRPELRDDPEGRYRHEVVYDGQHIYVLGGGTSQSVYDLQRIPAFNLKANQWDYFDTLPDRAIDDLISTGEHSGYPKPRKCFSCVQHTNCNGDVEAFITGGLQRDLVYFADIWKLNLRSKQWTWIRTASLPKPLYFHAAAQSNNNCMYIFGGIEYDKKNTRRCNDLYKMWMTIPKLSEMCWEAVLHYNENMSTQPRSKLLRMGIPVRFVQRLQPR